MPLDLGNMNLEERVKYLELKQKYKKKLLPWYKKWWGVIILVILGLIIVFGTMSGFYIFNETKRIIAENENSSKIGSDVLLKQAIYGSGLNYSLGSDTAPVKIVEFADFACPYCEQAHTILRKIVNKYPGQIKIIYRDLPLHEQSVSLALGARCAGEQGMFWEMHDQLFANQGVLTGSEEEIKEIIYSLAGTIGLNAATFDSCYTSKKYLYNISQDFTDAGILKIKGTPSWFINEKLVSGYIEEEDFFNLLEGYLSVIK